MSGDPEVLLQANDLDGALAALQARVRANPSDARQRVFLFQLLCVIGDWKRAITQLKVCAELDPEATPMAQTYREAIICEVFREKVFAGEKEPLIFGQPLEWIALMIQALGALGRGRVEQAAELRARAFEMAQPAQGEVNGERFEWIADADLRFGPLLEVVLNGKYYWMPFGVIHALRMEPPSDLRDAVWMPANLTLQNGGELVVLVPTRYPGTVASGDPVAMMARATAWEDAGSDTFIGTGQRVLATDRGDTPLMDLRVLRVDSGDG